MQENKNVNKMSIIELKSLAYDLLVQLENIQNNLKIVNGEIARRLQDSLKVNQEAITGTDQETTVASSEVTASADEEKKEE